MHVVPRPRGNESRNYTRRVTILFFLLFFLFFFVLSLSLSLSLSNVKNTDPYSGKRSFNRISIRAIDFNENSSGHSITRIDGFPRLITK